MRPQSTMIGRRLGEDAQNGAQPPLDARQHQHADAHEVELSLQRGPLGGDLGRRLDVGVFIAQAGDQVLKLPVEGFGIHPCFDLHPGLRNCRRPIDPPEVGVEVEVADCVLQTA